MIFFFQNLHKIVGDKFKTDADSVVADFIFGKWIMKSLHHDGNKNGLITSVPVTGQLQSNLVLAGEALKALISNDLEQDDVDGSIMGTLPQAIQNICSNRRA